MNNLHTLWSWSLGVNGGGTNKAYVGWNRVRIVAPNINLEIVVDSIKLGNLNFFKDSPLPIENSFSTPLLFIR